MSRVVNINVGILGHVDSGKTSLVKALSTSLSTAALDKHPQSQQRGITLDLGFSAFSLPLPDHLIAEYSDIYDLIQFTLVDCPGHASLIKTIIGGAQIIDMIILVVDANKGIQTQTAECLVIGEMTTDNLIIALNKIDAIPEEDRAEKLEKVSKRIQAALSTTKFKNAPIIQTAACVGGEKVAALTVDGVGTQNEASAPSNSIENETDRHLLTKEKNTKNSIGIDSLTDLLKNSVRIPTRNTDKASFYFAIDHCFPIKGHGTVLTGTVLSGSVSTNAAIELPYLQQQRKVKSMQMFRKPVKKAGQGDRVGICVTSLDATSIERGIAAEPGSVPLLSSVICMVKKVRYFRGVAKSDAKFHVSIGHTTVLATAIFYGAKEISQIRPQARTPSSDSIKKSPDTGNNTRLQTLNTSYHDSFPSVNYDWDAHYHVQHELCGNTSEGANEDMDQPTGAEREHGSEPVQWALLHFQQPVFCPLGSLIIGSRLDMDTKSTKSIDRRPDRQDKGRATEAESNKSCRLAFYGPIRENFGSRDMTEIKLFTWKQKYAEVFKHSDVRSGGTCYEIVAHNLYSEGGSVTPFIGMKLLTPFNHIGVIIGSFGAGGKFKVKFSGGVPRAGVPVGSKLLLRFKRFVYDKDKSMRQFATDFDDLQIKDPTAVSETNAKKTVKTTKVKAKTKANEEDGKGLKGEEKGKNTSSTADSSLDNSLNSAGKSLPYPQRVIEERRGIIEALKEDGQMAIVSGIFTMAEDIRSFAGADAIGPSGEQGELIGPYAKLGKCKIRFNEKIVDIADGRVTLRISK